MNWSNVKLILAREIRDQLRDRRTLFMIAVLPLLLYPLLGMSFFQIAQFMREHPTKVLLIGTAQLDELEGFPALVEDDRFAADLFGTKQQIDLLELEFADEPPGQTRPWADADPTHRRADAQQVLRSGEVQVIVYFPPKFAQPLRRFRQRLLGESEEAVPAENETTSVPSPTVYYNASNEKSPIAAGRVTRVLETWRGKIARQYLRDSNVPLLAAQPFGFETSDVASRRHRDAAVWSKLMPFVLLIWALTGAFYPAIDLCAGEKERGTLETLLSSPAARSEIVWGKLLTIMLFSVATAVLNLMSMSLTASLAISQLNKLSMVSETTPLSLPPLSSFLWLSVALLPIAALFSALCLALAAFARSTKEGQYYLMPLVLVTMPLMVLPMAPGVELNLGNSLIPLTGVMLLLRALLEGNYLQALPYVLPVVVVTLGCCLLAIRWAIDQFNKESVLFRESERLDLGLWARQLVRDRGPTPTMTEAVSCFVLILLIQFFMNLAMPAAPPSEFRDFALLIFTNMVVLIALPALLMTILFTRSPAKTLLLDRFPAALSIPAAVLLAIALHPLVQRVSQVVLELYPLGPEVAVLDRLIKTLINDAPYAWLPFLLLAALPAICEELAFRGFILSGLRRMGHKWGAIVLSAVMFGMAHGILQQSIMAALVGVVLGYLAVQTGSLWPCMAYHVTHNTMPLVMEKVQISPTVYEQYPQLAWLIQRSVENGQESYLFGWPLLAASTVVAVCLFAWFRRLPHEMTAEEELQEALEHQSAHSLAG